MASMSKGFDGFLIKLQQAEKAVERMADKSREFSKNIASSDTAVGKVAQATGMVMQGGKAALGSGKQMMASSLGAGFTNRQLVMNPTQLAGTPGAPSGPRFPNGGFNQKEEAAYEKWHPKQFKSFEQASTGVQKRVAQALGLGKVTMLPQDPDRGFIGPRFESGATTSSQNALYGNIVDKNKALMEKSQNRLFRSVGLDREQYQALSKDAQRNVRASMYGPQDTIDLLANLGTGFGTFLPGVADSIDRGAGYYNATNYMGNSRSRLSLEEQTLGRFNQIGGMTSKGADAKVAEYLTGRGMSGNREIYNQTINTVANAGRYMNIANETAAASIEGLTSASGSGKMLQSFGIYTADITTGKEKTQAQIFEELAQRLTAGRGKADTEQTMASIRRGALGVTIDSYFQGDTAGAQMFKQYMIERAQGKTMDFSQGKEYGQAGNNRNPLNSQMSMAISDTHAMQAAEDSYVKGLEAAVGPLNLLNMAAGALAQTFAGLPNALLQSITGHNTGKGILQSIEAITNFGSKGISGMAEAFMNADMTTPWSGIPALTEVGLIGSSMLTSLAIAGTVAGAGAMIGLAGHLAPGSRGGSGTNKTIIRGYGGIGGGGSNNPIISSYGAVTQELGNQNVLYARNGSSSGGHGGTDYGTAWGAPIKALADGTVKSVVNNHPQQDQTASHSYGNHVILSHPGGYTTKYAHLSRVAEGITVGKPVTAGQVIGYAGNSGYTRGANNQTEKQNGILHSGTHLHLEIWKGSQQIDPSTLGPNGLVQGTSQGVDRGSSLAQADPSVNAPLSSGEYTGDKAYIQSALDQFTAATTPTGNMAAGMSLLSQLYSGDTNSIMSAVSTMASGLGLSQSQIQAGINGSSKYTPTTLSSLPSGLFSGIPGASGYAISGVGNAVGPVGAPINNNVSIVVQVPDTSDSEALKFAKLVKGYLQTNSLMSSTGRV
jgi:murein DD-endopeptidase MepM/ murein hydrolase activator NlpD